MTRFEWGGYKILDSQSDYVTHALMIIPGLWLSDVDCSRTLSTSKPGLRLTEKK